MSKECSIQQNNHVYKSQEHFLKPHRSHLPFTLCSSSHPQLSAFYFYPLSFFPICGKTDRKGVLWEYTAGLGATQGDFPEELASRLSPEECVEVGLMKRRKGVLDHGNGLCQSSKEKHKNWAWSAGAWGWER